MAPKREGAARLRQNSRRADRMGRAAGAANAVRARGEGHAGGGGVPRTRGAQQVLAVQCGADAAAKSHADRLHRDSCAVFELLDRTLKLRGIKVLHAVAAL